MRSPEMIQSGSENASPVAEKTSGQREGHAQAHPLGTLTGRSPQQQSLELMQRKASQSPRASQLMQLQQQANASGETPPLQRKANHTGLPDNLKSGVESLSGYSMDDVKVHYNSSQPAQMQAHAFAQGNQIHLGPGQERHLPHEAWHVVQQKQGRV